MLNVDEELGTIAPSTELDRRILHGTFRTVAERFQLDHGLGDIRCLDLDDSRRCADDEGDRTLDGECVPPHRRHPRRFRGGLTGIDGECLGGRRSPISFA